jgi:hypothetical protein
MQHREPSLRGYSAGEGGGSPAHVAEVILHQTAIAVALHPVPDPHVQGLLRRFAGAQ